MNIFRSILDTFKKQLQPKPADLTWPGQKDIYNPSRYRSKQNEKRVETMAAFNELPYPDASHEDSHDLSETVRFGMKKSSCIEPRLFDFEPPPNYIEWPETTAIDCIPTENSRKGSILKIKKYPDLIARSVVVAKHQTASAKGIPSPGRKYIRFSSELQQAPTVASPTQKIYFLDLPGEIRETIYRLVTVSPKPVQAQIRLMIYVTRLSTTRHARRRRVTLAKHPLEPGLASVNRQLRREVLAVHYGENTFVFEHNDLKYAHEYPGRENMHDMTQIAGIQLFGSKLSDPMLLRSVKIRLNAVTKSKRAVSYAMALKKTAMAIKFAAVTQSGELADYCSCAVSEVVKNMISSNHSTDVSLMDLATEVARKHSVLLPVSTSTFSSEYRCGECDRVTLYCKKRGEWS